MLRMKEPEISEVAVRVKNFGRLQEVASRLSKILLPLTNKKGGPMFELDTWAELTPFNNIVRMLDFMKSGHQGYSHRQWF